MTLRSPRPSMTMLRPRRAGRSASASASMRNTSARASNDVATAVANAVRDLERVGARVVKVKVPDVDPVIEAWTTMARC